jgi:hypothetical protein
LVDEAQRKVIQFDGKPAVQAYAEALGMSPEHVSDRLMAHALALMVNGEPFVRSPFSTSSSKPFLIWQKKTRPCPSTRAGTDIVADTGAAIAAKKSDMGKIAGAIDFQCILRTLDLREQKRCEEYGGIFSDVPAIGFSTYGEQYLGHMNQSSVILLLR